MTVMDPCCGSGHFLVDAFGMLWRMRAEEEGLSLVEAQDAVLRDKVAQGRLGMKTGAGFYDWPEDRRLAERQAHVQRKLEGLGKKWHRLFVKPRRMLCQRHPIEQRARITSE